jgi:hypothetical protein
VPYLISTHCFDQAETGALFKTPPLDHLESCLKLLNLNNKLMMGRRISSALYAAVGTRARQGMDTFPQPMNLSINSACGRLKPGFSFRLYMKMEATI